MVLSPRRKAQPKYEAKEDPRFEEKIPLSNNDHPRFEENITLSNNDHPRSAGEDYLLSERKDYLEYKEKHHPTSARKKKEDHPRYK